MIRLLESLQVFHGKMTPSRAVVHVRLAGDHEFAGLSLSGTVRGPRCRRGHTLPATYRLVEAFNRPQVGGVDKRLHAEALLTDPVFWSPDWPALYDLTVELCQGMQVIDRLQQAMGLRPLTVGDQNLTYAGKTWVLRGVRRDHDLNHVIDACSGAAAALMAPAQRLDEGLLKEASEQGVLVIAQLSDRATAAAELRRLSRFAAVAIATLPPESEPFFGDVAGDIVLAHVMGQGHLEMPASDVRLVLSQVGEPESFARWAKALSRPVIACRPLATTVSIAEARRECDRLQRDLAPYGQFAGYIV